MMISTYDIVFVARKVFLMITVFILTIGVYEEILGDKEYEKLLKWMHLPLSEKVYFIVGFGSLVMYMILDFYLAILSYI